MLFSSSLGSSKATLGLGFASSFVLGVPSPTGDLDPFSVDPGVDAGRIVPDASDTGIPIDGARLFCLGHDLPGFFGLVAPGDSVEVSQVGDFTGTDLLTFASRTRAPATPPPSGYAWVASVLIDGAVQSARTITDADPENWATWMVNTSKLSGDHTLTFRLELTGPAPPLPLIDLEIPAFYVDNVALATATGPVLINAIPDVDQGISTGSPQPVTTAIDFDLVDFGVSGILTSSIHVTVDGVDALLAGVFQTGFSGAITSPSSDTKHVHIVKATPFGSAATVHVSVTATTNAAAPLVPTPTAWSFRVADIEPPVLTGGAARATTLVRATFDEAVRLVDPDGAFDGLNPTLYTLVPQITVGGTVPAVTPIVIGVAEVTSTTVDLTTDIDLSPGVDYLLEASAVADLAGNHAATTTVFTAFVPPKPAGRTIDLYRCLPQINRDEDRIGTQDLLRFVRCLQEICDLLLFDADRWSDILDPDLADDAFLDAMLTDLGNPFPFVLSTLDKRRLLRLLIALYRQKGTDPGIRNAIRFFLGLDVTIEAYDGEGLLLGESELGVDWILGPGTSFALYAYRIVAAQTLTADQRSKITFLAKYMQPAHTHLIEIVEPSTPPVYDPMVLGVSHLGYDWLLH